MSRKQARGRIDQLEAILLTVVESLTALAATITTLTVNTIKATAGTVTQGAGSGRATGVTLNNVQGVITTNSTSLAAGAEATFTVTNSKCQATSIPVVAMKVITTGTPVAHVTRVADGEFDITLTNLHASTADTSADQISFFLINAA
jgi:hypothetical protein